MDRLLLRARTMSQSFEMASRLSIVDLYAAAMDGRVLVTARHFSLDDGAREIISSAGFEIIPSRFGGSASDSDASESELGDLLRDSDGLIRGLAPVTAELIGSSRNLRVISVRGVGTDGIDLSAAKRRGIKVTITPGALDQAVAEHTLASMFALARGVVHHDRAIRGNDWSAVVGSELAGSTVGVVGLGHIGRRVARLCGLLGMHILGHSRSEHADWAQSAEVSLVGLVDLVSSSDFITLHVALTPQTRHLIGRPELGAMKRSAYLINTSRGAVVDDRALAEALRTKAIAGAALDVFEREPLPPDHLFMGISNVILSPHAAAVSRQGLIRSNNQAAANVVAVLRGSALSSDIEVV